MERSQRAPYEAQIKELEREGFVQFDKEHNIYAVLKGNTISIRWKMNGRDYQLTDVIFPGMVLYPRPRRLSKWEKEEWKNLSVEQLEELGVNFKWKKVIIVHRFDDLWSAIRQRGRHIIDNLVERRIKIDKDIEIVIVGEAQRMKDLALKLDRLANSFLKHGQISPQMREKFSKEVLSIYEELEKARNEFKPNAAKLLKKAAEGREIEIPIRLLEAAAKILERWVEILDIAESCLKQAENWLLLCEEIERKISWTYKRLAELSVETQEIIGNILYSGRLYNIADELEGIRIYLSREVCYNPYYQRVFSKEVQNLSKARKYAQVGRVKPILNLINKALSKLGAVVFLERPTLDEIRKRKEMLPKG